MWNALPHPTEDLPATPTTKPTEIKRFYALAPRPDAPRLPGYRVNWEAGNSDSVTESGINVDKTAPVISGAPTTVSSALPGEATGNGPVT